MRKYFLYMGIMLMFLKSNPFHAQSIDDHFFFLNNSLVNSDPVTYVPGSVFLSGVDYNEGANTGFPSYLGNFYSNNVSMTPFCSSARKAVYNFRQKTGLKYNNGSGSNFDDYTITVIIKFNTTPSRYFRVIDFSEGNSDNGIYNFQNNLNFYPTGNVRANAFSPNNFTFLTLTRDGSSNTIDVYINDTRVTTYTDSAGLYKFPNSGNIIFARDNIPPSSAPNEDTNGQIAYIHITNAKSTAAEVKDVFDNICSLIPPNINAVNDTETDANWQIGGTVLNVFDNDERENIALNPSDVTMTVINPDPTGNITLNPDGTVDLLPNAPIGTYNITYSICDNTYPSICDTATVTITTLPIPTVVSITDNLVCFQGTGPLMAIPSSGVIHWYDSLIGGTLLGTGNTYTPPTATATTTYYVEAVDNWRISAARTPVTLTVQHTALPTALGTQTFCDTENATISDLAVTGTDIKWYETDISTTPLLPTEMLVTGRYYVTQTLNTCESPRLPVDVTIYETVSPISVPYVIEACDTNTDGDDTNGIINFDLTESENTLVNGRNPVDYDFYYFEDAARTVVISNPTNYENIVRDRQTVYVRIANTLDNSCFTDVSFDVIVHPLPVVNSVVDLIQCDTDADGQAPFNLTEANRLISADYMSETFTYYESQAEAETGFVINQITNFTTYTNVTPLSDVVYTRIETSNGCYRTAQVNLIVGVSQIPSTFTGLEYYECDTADIDNDNTNGITAFDFSDAKTQIEALFPAGGVTVTFYNNEADALAELNAISNSEQANHRNEGYPHVQNIYVRVDSDAVNACLGLGHYVTLTVDSLPIQQPIADYVLCSDTSSTTFDLTTKIPEIAGSQTRPLIVSFHESEQDAIDNISIGTPNTYNSTSKTIYVRVQFDDNNNGMLDPRECVNTDMSFQLVVNLNPVIAPPDPIHLCSEQVDKEYDLTIRSNQITGGDSSIGLQYFESQLDLDNNNAIANPNTYVNTQLDRDIIVLATGTNGCLSTTILSLKTSLYADLNLAPLPIEECEVDNNGFDSFDIRRREMEILNGLDAADFEFFYYESESDAIAGNNNAIQSPGNFTNTIKDIQVIYVRVKPIDNECYQIVDLTLIVNPVPEIAIEDEYVICLDATSQSIAPQLNTFLPNPPIDTGLNITDYSFQWYSDTGGLPQNIIPGATDAAYIPTIPGDYTVIATNRITECTIPATTKVIGSYPPEDIEVELLSDAFSGNNILEINVTGNGEYEFKLDTTDWQTDNRFENVRGGERIIYVRDIYNCNEISAMKVIIDYPKYFTPNGDGVNDTWNIRGINKQLNAKIYVYNRYGKLLKQLSPTSSGWNGAFNGEMMPTDDYWFTLEYIEPRDNTVRIFKSHFSLKR